MSRKTRPQLSTDRELLRCIFDMHRADIPLREDPFLPIDLYAIAKRLGEPAELVYGRLYFDMGTRLRHRDPGDPRLTCASIYEKQAGDKRNVVNFPYLVAHLATLEAERSRALLPVRLSVAALVVSVASVAVAYFKAPTPATSPALSASVGR